jgi:hypothetical protein
LPENRQRATGNLQLSLIAVGHLPAEAVAPLVERVERLEVLELDVPPRDDLAAHRAELNRAVDAASNDWIVIVRERESVGGPLAAEIAEAVEGAKAWGFRIGTVPLYAGKPLRIGARSGELRLFHRRHFLRRGELGVQGTVVRLDQALTAITFGSSDQHRAYLMKTAVPHSSLRRTLIFLRNAVLTRARDANTLRYLWIEAAFDHG